MKSKTENLIKDERMFLPDGDCATTLNLDECLEMELLISPDTKSILKPSESEVLNLITDGTNNYSMYESSPVLYPKEISESWVERRLPLEYNYSALLQYTLLSQIKQYGEINVPLSSDPARKHQWRFKDICKDLNGIVLDVGCDEPSHSTLLIPKICKYIGLDPYAGKGEFRIIGLGEILPISSESVDAVTYNTSLDHILDYHTALEEAHRVLKPDGSVVIATYSWLDRATLLTDDVHFHHFRDYEVLGAVEEYFSIKKIKRYEDPKCDNHRYGLYIMACK